MVEILYTLIVTHITIICVTVYLHRGMTHKGLEFHPILSHFMRFWLWLTTGMVTKQWVAIHRKHHRFTDKEGDPHSPKDGFVWAHCLWFLPNYDEQERIKKYAPDLMKDNILMFFHKYINVFIALSGVILYFLGSLWDSYTGWSFVAWGLFMRTFFDLHITWFVNSASHTWGYRNYETSDNSRNLWWVALLSWGEGWHNNHHKMPRCAMHGHKWWELDITYWCIKLMEKLGLAWDVVELK